MDYSLYTWERNKGLGTVYVSFVQGSGATFQGADVIARSLFASGRKVRLFAKSTNYDNERVTRAYWVQ
jgi:hypothetical protein